MGLVPELLESLDEASATPCSEANELENSSAELDAAIGVRRSSMLLMPEDETGNGIEELSVSLKSVTGGSGALAMVDDSVCEGSMSVLNEAGVSGVFESV